MKIKSVEITPMPVDWSDPMPQVIATMEDGAEHVLFSYYPDEISFSPSEFVGLTASEGRDLKRAKDVAYLRG
jgi:hypothetical protein